MLNAAFDLLIDFTVQHPIRTSILIIIVIAYIFKCIKSDSRTSLPGPYGLPVVGYLPFLKGHEYLDLAKLQKTYGNTFSIKLGSRKAIVLNDFKDIKEAFNRDELSDRPPGAFTLSDDVQHMGDLNLKDWKETRRFTLSTLRTLGMGKNKLEKALTEEVDYVLERLSQFTDKSEINVHKILVPAINNIIISLICGKKLKGDTSFSEAIDDHSRSAMFYWRVKAMEFYLPFLKPILPLIYPGFKKALRDIDKIKGILWKEISSHEEEFEESSREDYMDHFIGEMRKKDMSKKTFTRGVLNGNSQLLLLAGNDTTLTTLEWALMFLAQHQDIQERAYQEIVQTIGKERSPGWDDKENLPYLDAVIAECYRYKTIVPLADPHWASADIPVGRYVIPKGTMVFCNIHVVHMNPVLWKNPEEFNPDRFMGPDGKRTKDPEFLIPFSIGKRLCPGEKLARVEIFLFLGAILQKFKIFPPPSGLNMEDEFDIVVHPKNPFVKIQTRD